jgi:magnesium transporter
MTETHQFGDALQVWEEWPALSAEERCDRLRQLASHEGDELFLSLDPREQGALLMALAPTERRRWVRLLPPDDAADLIQEIPADEQGPLLDLIDDATRADVRALLAYAEDDAGGLMNPRYARVRPEMLIDEAITYLRRQAASVETIYYAYVLDNDQRLKGVISLRDLFQAPGDAKVQDRMQTDVVTVPEDMDQEAVGRLYVEQGLLAIPVLDASGRMKGIITYDDIAHTIREEATEDIQKLGAVEALEIPYMTIGFRQLVQKRAGWLAALFLGELLTATAMAYYQAEVATAVVLAMFLPLIISSGGNSGSQATTLVIRAMGLGEVRLKDWWRVLRRELAAGLVLGIVLGLIGLLRILVWQQVAGSYGIHYALIAATVSLSLVGVVLWGSLMGAMLPFLLRRLGFDPASASAPLVATLVDVTGLIIYFTVAKIVLTGTLL